MKIEADKDKRTVKIGLPNCTHDQIIDAIKRFDSEMSENMEWSNWQNNENYKYAIDFNGKLYPVKTIISMATGVPVSNFSGGIQSNNYMGIRGFKVVELDRKEAQLQYWWVNQGATLESEKKGEFIWAPLRSKSGQSFYHWRLLSEINKGDIILHYANGALRHISKVTKAAVEAKQPDSLASGQWEQEGRLVECKYHPIDPHIPLEVFNQELLQLEIDQGPLTKGGGVKQGYLFRFTEEGLKLIQKSKPDTKWPSFISLLPHTAVTVTTNEHYPLEQCSKDTGFGIHSIESWIRGIERKGQAIIYGPPGTGKTYVAEKLAKHLISDTKGICELVQFHPSYSYEDFIQGIRPVPRPDGTLSYPVVPGRFLEFCETAEKVQDTCVLIIDEINRANLSRVFGELMYLLEYRDSEIPLAAGGLFRIPNNVRLIGTMNTADRSIALVDHALRRRFAFLNLYPNYEILKKYHHVNHTGFDPNPLIDMLKLLNNQINDPHYEVGITFFLRQDLSDQLGDIWMMEIEPYLEEYFFDQAERVDEFRWEIIRQRILP